MFLKNKPGDIIDIAVYDCFEGKVKLLEKGWHKIYIEIVDVCMCYSCQVQLPAGERMWISYEEIYKEESRLRYFCRRKTQRIKDFFFKKKIERLKKKATIRKELPF